MAASLEKPGLTPAAVLGGSKLGTGGTDFYIKVIDEQANTYSPAQDLTGDGDTTPHFENNGLIYERGVIRGAMIASQAIGLANLVDTSKNPVVNLVMNRGAARKETKTVLIEAIARSWRRGATNVGVAIRYVLTDSLPVEAAIS